VALEVLTDLVGLLLGELALPHRPVEDRSGHARRLPADGLADVAQDLQAGGAEPELCARPAA